MHEALIANLNSRLDAAKLALGSDKNSYAHALAEYVRVLGTNKEAAKAFEKSVLSDYIDPTIIEHIHFLVMIEEIMRAIDGEKMRSPLFLTEAIEKKFGLREKFIAFLEQEKKRSDIAVEKGIPMSEVVIPEDEHVKGFTDAQEFNALYLVHNRVIAELQETSLEKPSFNKDTAVLSINNIDIPIKKHSVIYDVLTILFKNEGSLEKTWQFSEISELFDSAGNQPDKKFYNAVYQLNQKAKLAGIDRLFITTRQSVKVNPEYLLS